MYPISPQRILELRGSDRATFLQGMVSNDVLALAPGQTCHACLLDSTGHILADLQIHAEPDRLLLAADPRCFDRLYQTLEKYLIMEDVSLTEVPAEEIAPQDAEAAEIARIEAGIPGWGKELDESVLLPEAEMDDAVSYTKGCYVGQEIVARLQARGHTNRALRGILLAHDAPVPPSGTTLHVPEDGPEPGREIGRITSAVASPLFGGRALALGYVRKEYFADGTPIAVQIAQPGGAVFEYHGTVLEKPFRATS